MQRCRVRSQSTTSSRILDLSSKLFAVDDIKLLALALERNTSLQELALRLNRIDGIGANAIAAALQRNTSLQKLLLCDNHINDDGAMALATALQHNTSLHELHLDSNDISDRGAAALVAELRYNKTLQILTLRQKKQITDRELIAQGQTLTCLIEVLSSFHY